MPIETVFTIFKESYCLTLKTLCYLIGRLEGYVANCNFVDEYQAVSKKDE
jgi:hypothetical protein